MKVFTDTNYREHGAGDLVEYLDKEDGLRNRLGDQMSEEEIQAFIEKSNEYEFERQIVISPENGEQLSDRELSQYTRKVMSEFCTDRQTATYCYAIHRDTDHPHTQVAVTGTKRDLYMDREDCLELREQATEQFHDQHNELTTELSERLEAEFEEVLYSDQALDTEPVLESGLGADLAPGEDVVGGDQTPTREQPADGRGQDTAESPADADGPARDDALDPEMGDATEPTEQREAEVDQQVEQQR
jgi:hypothetical protein